MELSKEKEIEIYRSSRAISRPGLWKWKPTAFLCLIKRRNTRKTMGCVFPVEISIFAQKTLEHLIHLEALEKRVHPNAMITYKELEQQNAQHTGSMHQGSVAGCSCVYFWSKICWEGRQITLTSLGTLAEFRNAGRRIHTKCGCPQETKKPQLPAAALWFVQNTLVSFCNLNHLEDLENTQPHQHLMVQHSHNVKTLLQNQATSNDNWQVEQRPVGKNTLHPLVMGWND